MNQLLPLAWGNPLLMLVLPVAFIAMILIAGGLVGLMVGKGFRIPREFLKPMIGLFALSGLVGFSVWAVAFNPPLTLPDTATDVQISRAAPFGWEINNNMRFKIKEPEFRLWIESLVGRPWTEMLAGGTDARIAKNFGFQRPLSAPDWMESTQTTNGYTVTAHPKFYGTIWYDIDREVAHYHFYD
jgi:hypothetical protein